MDYITRRWNLWEHNCINKNSAGFSTVAVIVAAFYTLLSVPSLLRWTFSISFFLISIKLSLGYWEEIFVTNSRGEIMILVSWANWDHIMLSTLVCNCIHHGTLFEISCPVEYIWSRDESGLSIPSPSLCLSFFTATNSLTMYLVLVTNFIQPYLHQFFIDSHSLNGYGKPLKRPFDRY